MNLTNHQPEAFQRMMTDVILYPYHRFFHLLGIANIRILIQFTHLTIRMTSHSALSVACYKTKYCADVVECCPHEAWQNSLICGTYELNEAEQTRHGGFYNVKVRAKVPSPSPFYDSSLPKTSNNMLALQYDLESDELAWDTASFQPTSGIFDAKWYARIYGGVDDMRMCPI